MCIAFPVKIVGLLDAADSTVMVEGAGGREEVKAALVVDDAEGWSGLPGRWAITHAGFILSLIDEDEARSRLAVFAAMDGRPVADGALRSDDGGKADEGQSHA